MKNYNHLIIPLVAFCFLLLTVNIHSQIVSTAKTGFENMSFSITLDSTEYIQLEPIRVKYNFSNATNKTQTTIIPNFEGQSVLEVEFDGVKKQFDTKNYSGHRPGFPVIFQPGQEHRGIITLDTYLPTCFPKPGKYTIRLSVSGTEEKVLKSNPVEITIKEPTGIDKEAFDFIKQNKAETDYSILYWWNNDGIKLENGNTLLEEFVDRYRDSIYGDYATFALALRYKYKNEPAKAAELFNRLKCKTEFQYHKEVLESLGGKNTCW
jgi:hypothetical protein